MKKRFFITIITALTFFSACKPNNDIAMTDRLKIQELISNYAYYADDREARKQAELFAPDATVNVFVGKDEKPAQTLTGREELQQGFETLKEYEYTTHFNGQSTVTSIQGDKASGIAYCLAHHVKNENGKKTLLIMSIRYRDEYIKQDGNWYFKNRDLIIDWTDTRTMQ